MPTRYREAGGKRIHVARAEKALGKPLPPGAQVHHADGTRDSDGPLVICQDADYHKLLHLRMKVVRAGGNPDTQKFCNRCQKPKDFRRILPKSGEAANGVQGVSEISERPTI